MKLRLKSHPDTILHGNQFNVHAMFEVIAGNDDGQDSFFGRDLDVWLEWKQEWKDLGQALKDRDVIPDNYNTWFGEPKTDADHERGYFL